MGLKMVTGIALLTCAFWSHALAVDLAGIDIHGFISQGFLWSDDNNYLADTEDGSFQFNELGVNLSKELTDQLRVGIQFFSRDMGPVDNNDVIIDWAYGDYRWRDWLGLRAGVIRQIQGLYNETRDFDMLRTTILLPQSIYNDIDRDFYGRLAGGSLYGIIPMGPAGSLSYNLLIGTKNLEEDSGISRWVESSGLFDVTGYDEGVFYNGSIVWQTPFEGLRVGATGVKTTDLQQDLKTAVPLGPIPAGATFTNDITEFYSYVFSAEYIWRELVVAAEYMKQKTSSEIPNFRSTANKPEAYYFSATYRFTDWLELGSYYSVYYTDDDDKNGDNFKARGLDDFRGWQKDFALSARFDINEYWVFKLEGHRIDGAAQVLPQDNPDGLEEDWFLFAAKLTFSF